MTAFAYVLAPGAAATPQAALAPEYREDFWRPRFPRLYPDGLKRFAPHSVLHYTGMFSNPDYSLYLIRRNDEIVHHACVHPRDFRFPFMAADDLQIGVVETWPSERGRGLAAHAIGAIVARYAKAERTFWYIVDRDNTPSIRAVEKAGFTRRGSVEKYRRLGLSVLGSYRFTPPA